VTSGEGAVAARAGGMASMGEDLYGACIYGQAREVRRLLSGGADVNDADEQGGTPLMAGRVSELSILWRCGYNGPRAGGDDSRSSCMID
jgi:hypothetical protein